MFTGIVQATGPIIEIQKSDGGARLVIDATALAPQLISIGDSVSVSGVCLTVVINKGGYLYFDVSGETLLRTNLGMMAITQRANLELALTPSTRIGGHWVSGHIDDLGTIESIEDQHNSQVWRFTIAKNLAKFVAVKGSIAVDGVSLTVNQVGDDFFTVCLIPHTLSVTNFADRKIGDAFNIEVDLIARYAERLLQFRNEL